MGKMLILKHRKHYATKKKVIQKITDQNNNSRAIMAKSSISLTLEINFTLNNRAA